MNYKIKLKENGGFYNVYGDDCLFLKYIFNYKVNNGRSGFPKKNINVICDKLKDMKISYSLVSKSSVINNEFDDNKYLEYMSNFKLKEKQLDKINYIKMKMTHLNECDINDLIDIVYERIIGYGL